MNAAVSQLNIPRDCYRNILNNTPPSKLIRWTILSKEFLQGCEVINTINQNKLPLDPSLGFKTTQQILKFLERYGQRLRHLDLSRFRIELDSPRKYRQEVTDKFVKESILYCPNLISLRCDAPPTLNVSFQLPYLKKFKLEGPIDYESLIFKIQQILQFLERYGQSLSHLDLSRFLWSYDPYQALNNNHQEATAELVKKSILYCPHLSSLSCDAPPTLDVSFQLPYLKKLKLKGPNILSFKKSPNLNYLVLSSARDPTKLTDLAEFLEDKLALYTLHFKDLVFEVTQKVSAISIPSKVSSLMIDDESDSIPFIFSNPAGIERLVIEGEDLLEVFLPMIPSFTNLKHLTLKDVTDDKSPNSLIDFFSKVTPLHSLGSLHLKENFINNSTILLVLNKLPNLSELHLVRCKNITIDHILKISPKLQKLETLGRVVNT